MDNYSIDKKALKQKDREDTIKHYILGYILECAAKNDITVISRIKTFLVYELKIISEETFMYCLYKAKINRILMVKFTRENYKLLKNKMVIMPYNREEQLVIIRKLQEFASRYESGAFVNARMGETSFISPKLN